MGKKNPLDALIDSIDKKIADLQATRQLVLDQKTASARVAAKRKPTPRPEGAEDK